MNKPVIEQVDESTLEIKGTLTVNTVAQLRDAGTNKLKQIASPTVSLKHISDYDSSALALLTGWARDGKRMNKEVCFINLPSQLMAIAQLSGLEKILKLRNTTI